ncbi:MAG TPA: rod shape-determining protein [Armatimonadota bacterium]|nr:rod shape-determining protein [Armatimonadota bacterium]
MGSLSRDMGIDLGTANTLVHVEGRGIMLREPSVVAVDSITGRVLAVGEDAKRMVGRTPAQITAVRPLRDGVIADFDTTQALLQHFIEKVHPRRVWEHPRVVIGVPSGITEVERRAVEEATRQAGAWAATVIDEPMAAAIGAGLPVGEPIGSMIVDIGGGTTEVAVISLGGICTERSVRVAGEEMDEAIVNYVRHELNLYIGEATAEQIKIRIGSAFPLPEEQTMQIRGKDLMSGLPKSVTLTSGQVREAIREPLGIIVELVKETLDETPPELAADVMSRGIVLAGGVALLRGLDQLISAETDVPVYVADDPLTAVVMGTARYLEELDGFPRGL